MTVERVIRENGTVVDTLTGDDARWGMSNEELENSPEFRLGRALRAYRNALDTYQPTNNTGRPTQRDLEAAQAGEVLAEAVEHFLANR